MSPVMHVDVLPGQLVLATGGAPSTAPPSVSGVGVATPPSGTHVGRQIPRAPVVCAVRFGNVGAPAPKSRTVGSPVSQTHPLGQPLGFAPMTQSSVQKPVVPLPVAQKQTPLVVSALVHASPGFFVRALTAVVHSPMSGSQAYVLPSAEQSEFTRQAL